jgi:1-acyl-sn-glycerol-3-phosphate acyltransferase
VPVTLILPRVLREDPALYDGESLQRRDPSYIRDLMPFQEALFRYYFRVETRGFGRMPKDRPFLMVGNHNGGLAAPDTGMTMHAILLERGIDAPIYALVHPNIFKQAYLNVHAMKVGGIAATARMALRAIDQGAPLFIYPGAGDDAYKPFEARHKISFFGNDAFVRLALRFRIPIVPVISIGAHETLIVLDDGRQRAREWGLSELGVERLPLTYSFPHGLALGVNFSIPFPARMEIEMGPAIEFPDHGPKSVGDRDLVKFCYDHVERASQAIMDGLLARRRRRELLALA